jgi:hypothetical protein
MPINLGVAASKVKTKAEEIKGQLPNQNKEKQSSAFSLHLMTLYPLELVLVVAHYFSIDFSHILINEITSFDTCRTCRCLISLVLTDNLVSQKAECFSYIICHWIK